MSRPRVVLVEPRDSKRESFRAYLGNRFDVDAHALAHKALVSFTSQAPLAVVANIRQPGAETDAFFKQLRALPGGANCLLILYGHPAGPRPSARRCEKLKKDACADLYLSREMDEIDLEQVLALELLAPAEERVLDAATLDDVQIMSARRGEELPARAGAPTRSGKAWSFVARLFGQSGGVIDRLATHRAVTWEELFRARPTLHNLMVLLTKPVTPLVDELPSDRPLRIDEVARARASLQNVRILLRSGLSRMSASEAGPTTGSSPRP